jgi:hypothetical protein
LRAFRSHRCLIKSLLVAAGITLLTACGGVSPGGFKGGSNGALAASPSTLSFGNVQKGASCNLLETLTNSGGSSVTISAANLSGAGFSVSGLSLPATLSPNQRITFTLTFAPASASAASGTLAVVSNADNSTLDIGLSGT